MRVRVRVRPIWLQELAHMAREECSEGKECRASLGKNLVRGRV